MDSNRYGWYYGKTNMPIWIFLTPGRWWAELEFHLAGNGRLFLSGRRRRSVVWHIFYTLIFYMLIFVGLFFLLGGSSVIGDRQNSQVLSGPAEPALQESLSQTTENRPEPEIGVAAPPYEEVAPALAEEVPYEGDVPSEVVVEKASPTIPGEKVSEVSDADELQDLY